MKREQQDKLWNELSEESKEKYSKDYKEATEDCGESALIVSRELLAEIFGTHNLNPKPEIKTWEDIEKTNIDWSNIDIDRLNSLDAITPKMRNKLIATYKISKLIELGYGGMVSEEEWKNPNEKFIINPYYDRGKFFLVPTTSCNYKYFIAFHTHKQMEEFMSHESNRKLVEQYYMM